ncbi:YncE family protein [Longimycelium tulufanense]|uniref:YncE family protein n=1 Tax=Longimycelium tulufanense TaxID=907463 RepID=UPI001E4376B6|nr:beta-propeller fold lactonase family protein [Longimycelium tulufanense]
MTNTADTPASAPSSPRSSPAARAAVVDGLPGMPPVTNARNLYHAAGANMLSDVVKKDRPLVYVPHSESGDVWVIDPKTFEVVSKHKAGIEVQHVVPSYDMRTLYATDDIGDQMLPFDPATGKAGKPFPVIDPYNMYFTPDGKSAISVAERLKKLVWYDPETWEIQAETQTPNCAGIDHGTFTMDGRTAAFSCEWAGRVAVVDVASKKLLRMIDMPQRNTHMGPQDVALSPDGQRIYIADCDADGLWVLDGAATKVERSIPTGDCAHGLYFDREAKRLFVTNRLEGSISVLDAYTGEAITKWHIPGGGSPDMGNLTADGKQLWLSGRYHNEVYVLSTQDGSLIKRIPVGRGPHGLTVWPQPGRYSIGHTGITR